MLAALALGLLVAFAIRGGAGPRLRWTAGLAAVTTLGIGVALVVLLPPRGEIDHPQYYAHGADIPRALEAVDSAQRSTRVLDEELDAQLVGLARLVTEPGEPHAAGRQPAADGRLRPAQQRAHGADPRALGRRRAGAVPRRPDRPRLAAGGPHRAAGRAHRASRSSSSRATTTPTRSRPRARGGGDRALRARAPEPGRLARRGRPAGRRAAGRGHSDPFSRRSAENYADRFQPSPRPAQQDAFTRWMGSVQDQVDVIMVHEPKLIEPALAVLRDRPPLAPAAVRHRAHAPRRRSRPSRG